MIVSRSLATASLLVLVLAACGSVEGAEPIDAPIDTPDADPADVPSHMYVVDRIAIAAAEMDGLDLDERPNDGIDNELGKLMASLNGVLPDLDHDGAMGHAVDRGHVLWLHDLRAASLENAASAELRGYRGESPVPAPCATPQDSECRRHLAGSGVFQIATGTPTDRTLAGAVVAGRFTGGPGRIDLPFVVSDSAIAWLRLHMARARLDLTSDDFAGVIGGAMLQEDFDNLVVPAFGDLFRTTFARECASETMPSCGCASGSAGATIQGLFDNAPEDCAISDEEVRAGLSRFVGPDLDVDGDGSNEAVSIAVAVRAVTATFPRR